MNKVEQIEAMLKREGCTVIGVFTGEEAGPPGEPELGCMRYAKAPMIRLDQDCAVMVRGLDAYAVRFNHNRQSQRLSPLVRKHADILSALARLGYKRRKQ